MNNVMDGWPRPPCAETLGWQLLDADQARGWARIGFIAAPAFLNPAGKIQGGFLAAMLDDTMGPPVLIHTEGKLFPTTITMSVHFLASAEAGPLIGEGTVVRLGRRIGFVEAVLMRADGVAVARASASVSLSPLNKIADGAYAAG